MGHCERASLHKLEQVYVCRLICSILENRDNLTFRSCCHRAMTIIVPKPELECISDILLRLLFSSCRIDSYFSLYQVYFLAYPVGSRWVVLSINSLLLKSACLLCIIFRLYFGDSLSSRTTVIGDSSRFIAMHRMRLIPLFFS
jgi:hypothetical protein